MKILNSTNRNAAKYILILNLCLLLGYSIFILIFDRDLLIKNISSKEIFDGYILFKIIIGLVFFLNSLLIFKLNGNKVWLYIIIGGGLLIRVIFIPAYPVVENDFYRYLWDGAVTAHGINPYKYSPKEALEDSSSRKMPAELHILAEESGEIIQKINHPHIRTIYPPVAQAVFALSYYLFPWKIWGWKILILFLDLVSLFLFFKLLVKFNKPFVWIFFYWLNPVVIHEFYGGAHMDVILIPFLLMLLYFVIINSSYISTVLLSLAAGVKLWPAVFFPFVYRNILRDKRKLAVCILISAGLGFFIFYPVLVTVFDRSLGFVIYAESWTNNEALFHILHLVIKELRSLFGINSISSFQLTRWLTGILFLLYILFLARKRIVNTSEYFEKFLMTAALLFFISPTQFPWYFTWVIPFIVFRPMVSLLLYPAFLPLYQLNYVSPYLVYLQHLPVFILFIYELKNSRWQKLFIYNA